MASGSASPPSGPSWPNEVGTWKAPESKRNEYYQKFAEHKLQVGASLNQVLQDPHAYQLTNYDDIKTKSLGTNQINAGKASFSQGKGWSLHEILSDYFKNQVGITNSARLAKEVALTLYHLTQQKNEDGESINVDDVKAGCNVGIDNGRLYITGEDRTPIVVGAYLRPTGAARPPAPVTTPQGPGARPPQAAETPTDKINNFKNATDAYINNPADANARSEFIIAYQNSDYQNNPSPILVILRDAQSKLPNESDIIYLIGSVYYHTNQKTEALTAYKLFIEKMNSTGVGSADFKRVAISRIQELEPAPPAQPSTQQGPGARPPQAETAPSDPATQLTQFKDAYIANPEDDAAKENFVAAIEAWDFKANPEPALGFLREVSDGHPQDYYLLFRLAEAEYMSGNKENALEAYQKWVAWANTTPHLPFAKKNLPAINSRINELEAALQTEAKEAPRMELKKIAAEFWSNPGDTATKVKFLNAIQSIDWIANQDALLSAVLHPLGTPNVPVMKRIRADILYVNGKEKLAYNVYKSLIPELRQLPQGEREHVEIRFMELAEKLNVTRISGVSAHDNVLAIGIKGLERGGESHWGWEREGTKFIFILHDAACTEQPPTPLKGTNYRYSIHMDGENARVTVQLDEIMIKNESTFESTIGEVKFNFFVSKANQPDVESLTVPASLMAQAPEARPEPQQGLGAAPPPSASTIQGAGTQPYRSVPSQGKGSTPPLEQSDSQSPEQGKGVRPPAPEAAATTIVELTALKDAYLANFRDNIARNNFARAIENMDFKTDADQALTLLQEVLSKHPEDRYLIYLSAVAQYKANKKIDAYLSYKKWLGMASTGGMDTPGMILAKNRIEELESSLRVVDKIEYKADSLIISTRGGKGAIVQKNVREEDASIDIFIIPGVRQNRRPALIPGTTYMANFEQTPAGLKITIRLGAMRSWLTRMGDPQVKEDGIHFPIAPAQ
ncbi:MAG: tetratricopeptide repeat protein [Patescibacteria group bacterium]